MHDLPSRGDRGGLNLGIIAEQMRNFGVQL